MAKIAMVLTLCLLLILSLGQADAQEPRLYTNGNVLAAGNYNDGFSSSDLTLIIRLEAGDDVIFDEGAEVKYHVPDQDVEGWTELEFDDSEWLDGITSIGYADGDDNTIIQGGQVGSVYTRYHFRVPDASSLDSITFKVDYDDSYILWLNGVEIMRTANITILSPVGEIPVWDVSKIVDQMPDVESTGVPAGKPNLDRWDRAVTPREQDVSGTIHAFDIDVAFGGAEALAVEPSGKLAVSWAELKGQR